MQQLCRPSPMPSFNRSLSQIPFLEFMRFSLLIKDLKESTLIQVCPTNTNKLTELSLVGQWLRPHLEGENLTTSAQGIKINKALRWVDGSSELRTGWSFFLHSRWLWIPPWLMQLMLPMQRQFGTSFSGKEHRILWNNP